jgi:hypothetical protein
MKAWTLFRTAYPDEPDVARDFYIRLSAEAGTQFSDLTSLGLHISHLPFSCLTFLSIRNVYFQPSHLMSLFSIPHLAVLDLEQNGPERPLGERYGDGIDDRLIRIWSRAVLEQQAFTKLRVLILRMFPIELEDTLKWLTSWPALDMIRLENCYLAPNVLRSEEEQLFYNGNWKSLPTIGVSSRQTLNPGLLTRLVRSDIITSKRLKIIYDMACKSLNLPTLATSRDFHVSILYYDYVYPYGITSTQSSNTSVSLWFTRVPLSEGDAKEVPLLEATSKRPNSGVREVEGKKRKVREGKQKDVGALLGSFF